MVPIIGSIHIDTGTRFMLSHPYQHWYVLHVISLSPIIPLHNHIYNYLSYKCIVVWTTLNYVCTDMLNW